MRAIFAILIFSWIFMLFLPWWSIFLPSVIFGAWLIDKGFNAFLAGFFGAGLAWFFQALYVHLANEAILTNRIAEMIGLHSAGWILLITFIIGGLPGGTGALTGFLLKKNMKKTAAAAAA